MGGYFVSEFELQQQQSRLKAPLQTEFEMSK